ncbi:unnamed protein product [Symbiodinium natans]|uniref:BTB domain-containing protein n=1 Tax=Symbiodinium natans TaxID=878477 RepID=A0A812V499_9DINO|nr:unnamed protein product [Symbiodinium natans]
MVNSGNFEEAQTAQVVICDFSAAAVESFLRFLYSGMVEGSLLTLVEVAAVADKYQVHRLHALCVQACQHGLKPAMACAAFESADRLRLASIRRSAKEQILIHPGEALKDGQNLSPQLLSELLSSNLLCIENEALRRLLSAWGNQKKRKAAAMDDDSQQPIISRFMSELSKLSNRRPAQHSTVLKTLGDR